MGKRSSSKALRPPWQGDLEARSGDRLRLKLAFRHLAEWPLRGRPLAERMMAEFNQVAALAEWGLWFRANGRLSETTGGDLLALADVFQPALADLLGRMAYYTGADFVEHALMQAHDTLPWQLREVAGPHLLRPLPWARRLNVGQAGSMAEFLRSVPAFGALLPETLAGLAQEAKREHHPAGTRLFAPGQTLRWVWAVQSGRVQLLAQDMHAGAHQVIQSLDRGALAGWNEILLKRPAQVEARTVTPVELIRLPAEAVSQALREQPPRPEAALLGRIPLFRELSPEHLRRLAESLRPRTLLPDEGVVRHGETGRELYLIGRGELVVSVPAGEAGSERVVAQLGLGEFFGEMALLRGSSRSATVRAVTEAQVWSLSATDYAAFPTSGAGTGGQPPPPRTANSLARTSHRHRSIPL